MNKSGHFSESNSSLNVNSSMYQALTVSFALLAIY